MSVEPIRYLSPPSPAAKRFAAPSSSVPAPSSPVAKGFAKPTPPTTNFDGQGIHLLALGDYGTRGDENQIAVATGMAKFAKSLEQPLTAVLALGDNFYKPITPDRFENHFEKMYSKDGLNCPFYACARQPRLRPEVRPARRQAANAARLRQEQSHARAGSSPSKWYTFTCPAGDKPLVKAIVLDGNYWEGALTPKEKIAQRRFLKAELKKKTTPPGLWIVNHFPLFSDGKSAATIKSSSANGDPFSKKYPISLCFGGHDHIMQHVHVEGYQPSFIISGAGGASLYDIKPTDRGFVTNHHLGFNHLHVTPDEINVQYINAAGDCLHHFRRDQSGRVKVLA